MSYPNPPEPAFPQAPAVEAPPRPSRYRGRVPRVLGWIFLGIAVAAFVVGGIVLATKSLGKVNGFQRVPIPTANSSVTFSGTGKYVAYYEASDVSSDIKQVPLVRVVLQSPSGQVQPLTTLFGNRSDGKIKILTYDFNGHRGVALYQFTITEAGRYRVATEPTPQTAPDAQIAFGRDIEAGTIAGGLLIVVGVLSAIAAVVLLIVGYVKLSRHKRELRVAAFYGGAPPGYGPPPPGYGPPPPGYGPPGYGSPGYGQPPPGYGPPGYGSPGYGTPPPDYGGSPPSGEQPRFGEGPPSGEAHGESG